MKSKKINKKIKQALKKYFTKRNLFIISSIGIILILLCFGYYFAYKFPKQRQALFLSEQEKNRQQIEQLQQMMDEFKKNNPQANSEAEQQNNQPQEVIVKYEQPDNSAKVAECTKKVEDFKQKAKESGESDTAINNFLIASKAYNNCLEGKKPQLPSTESSITMPSFTLPNVDTSNLENEIKKQSECQKKAIEYTECNAKYATELNEYNQCISSGGVEGTHCTKPYNYCRKPLCL